jgi:hypothetical protein
MLRRIEGTIVQERLIFDGRLRDVLSVVAPSWSGRASSSEIDTGSAASACGERRAERTHMILCHAKPWNTLANTSHSFRFPNSYNSPSCLGSCSRSKGKRRNAWYEFTLFSLLSSATRVLTTHSPHAQCYFFDSDVGGFHYGPGHPYVLVRDDNEQCS